MSSRVDVAIIGAGPGGIYAAYELVKKDPSKKVVVFDSGYALEKRHCPIDGKKVKSCISCKVCSIMNGFGGAGAFPTVSITLPMTSAVPCTNTSDVRKPLI